MKAIMYVETQLASPDHADAYHAWYNDIHLKEVVGVEGVVSARRFEPDGHEGPYIAIYEIEADDLDQVRQRMAEALGTSSRPSDVHMDTLVVRFFRQIAEYAP